MKLNRIKTALALLALITTMLRVPTSSARAARTLPYLLISPQDTVWLRDTSGNILIDTTTGVKLFDSLRTKLAMDSLDTLYMSYWRFDPDVLPTLDSCLQAYYDSVATRLPDAKDLKEAQRRIKKEIRDSILKATPRIMETFVLPDSLYYERILSWKHDSYFNEIELQKLDTTFNYHFNDNPIHRDDLDATYLGTSGSATMLNNYFSRPTLNEAPFFEPYLPYSYTPETLPMYNCKTPHTELGYWGNPFIAKAREESNLNLLTTQNITPELNVTLRYRRHGSNGMMVNEATDDRTFEVGANYLGKKYSMHAAYMGQNVKRKENGGMEDEMWVRDTIVDLKSISTNLSSAMNTLKRRTLFIDQSLAVPLNFFRKDADSLAAGQGTVAYIGHSGELTRYTKLYTDEIATSNAAGRDFYRNQFYIDETASRDSIGVTRFENKFFIKLQPYANDAVLSKINAGVGYQILKHYQFSPDHYLTGIKTETDHNIYLYGGASGMFKKYFKWDAFGKYNIIGYNFSDLLLMGNVQLSFYPWREGIHLKGHFETSLNRPSVFENYVCFNHHNWDLDLKKESVTKIEATLDVPAIEAKAFFGYALLANTVYYDSLSVIAQHVDPISVMSASVEKNFKLGPLHLDNRVLFQISSNQEVMPLPTLTANLRYYLQFPLVKDVLAFQAGANAVFHTAYYMQGYMPDLGVFYNQREREYGNSPFLDLFINLQWKRACIFFKYSNITNGWPNSDYFSAPGYVRSSKNFKFGIWWPFYYR